MHDTLPLLLNSGFPEIHRDRLETLQVNLGYKCNQRCRHCHVNAGPKRQEMMARNNVELLLEVLESTSVESLDITGGAPEMHPDFRYLVQQATTSGVKVIDRCNLTILNEDGYQHMPKFLAQHKVEIVASMPCYLKENVDAQRGDGVYKSSIKALKKLNSLGYGNQDSGLLLNLVYNPAGPVLPPSQETLLEDYKKELFQREGILFNELYCLTNMPIKRFGSALVSNGQFHEYIQLLKTSHQHNNLETVMCRNLLSVDWEGYVYDCDFNQILNLPLKLNGHQRTHLRHLLQERIGNNRIIVADHCYGCTAGSGSSCSGSLS